MNNYTVYKHTSPSGKVYIGITHTDPKKRWRAGKGYTGSKLFWNAIQKYGWENFTHEILYTNLSETDAKRYEIQLIAKYHSNDSSYGYNITIGGGGVAGYKQSPEHIKKRMEKTVAKLRGRKLSEEHKQKIKNNNSKYWLGKKRSPETRKKLSEAMSEEMKQKLIAAQNTPEARKRKIDAIRSRPPEFYIERNKCHQKAVAQYNPITGELIGIYESARLAQQETGTRFQDISNCIHGRQKTANGFKWALAEEKINV